MKPCETSIPCPKISKIAETRRRTEVEVNSIHFQLDPDIFRWLGPAISIVKGFDLMPRLRRKALLPLFRSSRNRGIEWAVKGILAGHACRPWILLLCRKLPEHTYIKNFHLDEPGQTKQARPMNVPTTNVPTTNAFKVILSLARNGQLRYLGCKSAAANLMLQIHCWPGQYIHLSA